MKSEKIIMLAIVLGAIAGGVVAFAVSNYHTTDDLVRDFYATESAVHVSPHHIRKGMAKGDESFVLVDLRSQEEYEESHVLGAVNVPAYKDRDHSDYGAEERIVNSFQELVDENPDKDIIVYCYSIPCMTGRKIGNILAQRGIYVQHLGVGWNEWRYYWNLWNHPHEWNTTNVEDYLWSGPEPGDPLVNATGTGCPIEGGFGC